MTLNKESLFNAGDFEQALAQQPQPLKLFRQALEHGRAAIKAYHDTAGQAENVVTGHTWLVDQLLQHVWQWHADKHPNAEAAALIAVGGYGRGELHPASDIDLLILLDQQNQNQADGFVETLLRFLWDMGLEVGHSVRTVKECITEAKTDITVATNIMETRLLAGNQTLFEKMLSTTRAPKLWPSKKFFRAKFEEQTQRHHHFDDTGYKLEPNVKEGPGGLRDLHMIMWIARRHYAIETLDDLVKQKLLDKEELLALTRNRNFLWQVRNSLHYLAGRREDRLLFDYQRTIANQMGYKDKPGKLAVEQFMKRYYRTIKEQALFNEIVLQSFQEIILARNNAKHKALSKHFRAREGFLEVANKKVFESHPSAMLEMFLTLQQYADLKGVRAHTIRLLRANLHRIDAEFRKDEVNRNLFMRIMQQPRGITHELRRMNAYGVLGAYIPVFGKILGQMQHDLFHVYTVDEHSLFVLRNLRRFTLTEFKQEFPYASNLMQQLNKPERVYLAALFHDVAKGRGGDHSILGERDAYKFCKHHGMSEFDARFVSWLVRHHLLLSLTAQRKDISDADVVTEFANIVGDQERLDNLYVLTVADMCGTNPNLWNDWKGHLLQQLYNATKRVLAHGNHVLGDIEGHVKELREGALEILKPKAAEKKYLTQFWEQMNNYYYLRYDADSLAWHAQTISQCSAADFPIVATRFNAITGGSEFLIYTPDREGLFVNITGGIDNMNLSIADARINTSKYGFALDTFVVLDHKGAPIKDNKTLVQMQNNMRELLIKPRAGHNMGATRVSRELRHFPITCQVKFNTTANKKLTIMEVTAQDRLGLLHQVALALAECKVKLVAAKVFTYGERAEDIFFITNRDGLPIDDEQQRACLKKAVYDRLQPEQNKDKDEPLRSISI